ncbi:MAG: hypothetical protein RIQ56_160 [Candidatus Parcubacteria bacterium]|jgi:hypothetical protein
MITLPAHRSPMAKVGQKPVIPGAVNEQNREDIGSGMLPPAVVPHLRNEGGSSPEFSTNNQSIKTDFIILPLVIAHYKFL